MIKKVVFSLSIIISLVFFSCSSDDGLPRGTVTLNLLNLEELENGFTYEGWLDTPNGVVSTGKFTSVNFPQSFSALETDITAATGFVLSIEPANDTDVNPSNTKILSGSFVGNSASLSINAQVADYTNSNGVFIMASPTDTNTMNDENGIWFMNPTSTPPSAGLNLPDFTTNSGWKYEGWVIENNVPVSTGTFLTVSGVDDFSPFSGNQPAPQFPGEDFLNSSIALAGVTFPLDVRGKQVVISIEPNPDDSSKPFSLKPLQGLAGQSTAPALNQLSLNSASFPVGTVIKN